MPAPQKTYMMKVASIKVEAPDIKTYRLEYPKSEKITFFPGQFFMIGLEGETLLKNFRSYSLSSSPTAGGFIEFTCNKVGYLTTKLDTLKSGETLQAKGPYGVFTFRDIIKEDVVFIAGGTGIAPFRSMVHYILDRKLPNKMTVLYSVKTPDLIIYHNELDELQKKLPNKFKYAVTITRPVPEQHWGGPTGRISMEFVEKNVSQPEKKMFFICGAEAFVNSVIDILKSLNVPPSNIKTERWGE